MEDRKKKIIICVVLGILLVFLGITFSVISILNQEKKDTQKIQNEIKDKYHGFKEAADHFTEARKEYQTVISEDLYVESVEDEYEDWMEVFKNYQGVVDKVIKEAESLDKLCVDKKYPDQTVMANCQAYMINYETVMNYFVKDVEAFNEFMETYYQDYQGDEEKYPKYELKDNYHYIDINDDGKFIGKD